MVGEVVVALEGLFMMSLVFSRVILYLNKRCGGEPPRMWRWD